jgi:hypothetical protein
MTEPTAPLLEPKDIMMLQISHKGPCEQTRKAVASMMNLGAGLLFIEDGASDPALARNTVMTRLYLNRPKDYARKAVLLIDDDNVMTVQSALRLCSTAVELRRPASGIYVDVQGNIMAQRRKSPTIGDYWETGAGFFAIPHWLFDAFGERCDRVQHFGTELLVWCWNGLHPERAEWMSEDKCICWRLAVQLFSPVVLCPIVSPHVKPVGLVPQLDEEALTQWITQQETPPQVQS